MPLTHIVLSVILVFVTINNSALALDCWSRGPVSFHFGTVTSGSTAQTNSDFNIACNNHDAVDKKVIVCWSLALTPLQMNTNPPLVPLIYKIYAASNPNLEIGINTSHAQKEFYLSHGEHHETSLNLIAKIPGGQTNISAKDYYDYGTISQFKYASVSTNESLPTCESITSVPSVQQHIQADAVVKDGCDIVSVSDLNFGSHSPVNSTNLTASSSSLISLRCPVGTSFTVSLGMGSHMTGSSRQMCNSNNSCIPYELYQDLSRTTPWNDTTTKKIMISSDGFQQDIPVYGYVSVPSWPEAGNYNDRVLVTLEY